MRRRERRDEEEREIGWGGERGGMRRRERRDEKEIERDR
jgi:hypothetical protein